MKLGRKALGLLALAACTGCAAATPRYAGLDADQLLDHGIERLADEKWDDAIRALEQFIFQYPLHDRYQEARYRLGEAHFGKEEYLIAASEFGRLANDFPSGPWAAESRFKVCDSYYHLSPKPQLDQEYTVSAIDHCLSLITYYPDSEYAATARTLVTELENKLAQKVLDVARHYYRRSAFDSAILYFEKVLAGFPSSVAAPRALLGLYLSYDRIGWDEEARVARERLLIEYPDSEEAEQLRSGIPQTPS